MIRSLLLVFFFAIYSQNINAQNFNLAPNGITVVCDAAQAGDTGDVNGVTYTKRDRSGLQALKKADENNPEFATTCTSGTTDLSDIFLGAGTFNQDISSWDVSDVTTMQSMFADAKVFNIDISSWDVSNVTTMNSLMVRAGAFNQDLGSWDVSAVTNMDYMFINAGSFSQDLTGWCVSNIPSEPVNFGSGSSLTSSQMPEWGSCPPPPPSEFYLADNGVTVLCPVAGVGDQGVVTIDGQDITFTKLDRAGIDTIIQADPNDPALATTCTSGITDLSAVFQYKDSFNQDIGSWDVSAVTTMKEMFQYAGNFNHSLEYWDVSGVTDMTSLFEGTYALNQPLGNWDVSNVTSMKNMFQEAILFDQDISGWDVSGVTNMERMFMGALVFNQSVENWDVSAATNMSLMFGNTDLFNQPIGCWNTSNVTNMNGMFEGARAFNQPIGCWDVRNVVNMEYMFYAAESYNKDLTTWCPTNIHSEPEGFVYTSSALESSNFPEWGKACADPATPSFNPVAGSYIDSVNVRIESTAGADIYYTLDGSVPTKNSALYTEPLKLVENTIIKAVAVSCGVNDSPVTEAGYTITEKPTAEAPVFDPGAGSYADSVNVSITSPTSGAAVYYTMDGSSPDTNAVLYSAPVRLDSSVTIHAIAVADGFNNSPVSEAAFTITETPTAAAPVFDPVAGSYSDSVNVTLSSSTDGASIYYTTDGSVPDTGSVSYVKPVHLDSSATIKAIAIAGGFNNSAVAEADYIITVPAFRLADNDLTVFCEEAQVGDTGVITVDGKEVTYAKRDIQGLNALRSDDKNNPEFTTTCTSGITSMELLFLGNTEFNRDISSWDVSSVSDMNLMFAGASSFNQDIGSWDVSNVTNVRGMFSNAKSFNQPLKDWDMSKVTNMNFMFGSAESFNQPIGNWDVSNVTDMGAMFTEATSFNQDIGSWDVSAVTNMKSMFWDAVAFNQDISDWSVGNVTDMSIMFNGAAAFNQSIGSWDVSNVTTMRSMFWDAVSFNQAIDRWNVSKVTTMRYMFRNSGYTGIRPSSPKGISGGAVSGLAAWEVSGVTDMAGMFQNASSFNGDISSWDVSNVMYFDPGTVSAEATNRPDSVSGFLVGSGMSTDNASRMFQQWSERDLQDGVSINIGSIELNSEGAGAMKSLRESNNMDVVWGGEEGVNDEPVFTGLPAAEEFQSNESRTYDLWTIVEDPNTVDKDLQFSFSADTESERLFEFEKATGVLTVTAPAEADTVSLSIYARNADNIMSSGIMSIEVKGTATSNERESAGLPASYVLEQNYPNPFNPSTLISFSLPQQTEVSLTVFDMLGREIAVLLSRDLKAAGMHTVRFEAGSIPSGVYIYSLNVGGHVLSKKLTLVK